MPNKNRNRIINNIGTKTTMIPEKKIKTKKETILIEVAKDQVIGEFINGYEVIKPVKLYGKYYALVKNK
ncbi:hypothetical protein [Clostridium uliginosum]|uniref:Uncharacterized protein n=1 Tax=Clostridium uliginosum TaxID=119641 RepID=A0A1I1NHA8_9CLOT|nr:hypothetical protein [Clostridium uliginosum]SFC93110.1 hypothetical protein SAMN05421842_1143 [Clostridium uliginosum]